MPNAYRLNHFALLGNYLRTAVRSLLKQKLHTGLNLLGLSLGLAAALLIALWARFELSYDNFHPDAQSSYRVLRGYAESNQRSTVFHGPSVEFLRQQPEIKNLLSVNAFFSPLSLNGTRFSTDGYQVVEPTLLEMFALTTLAGDIHQTFREPNQLALSESQAYRIFGPNEVIGKTVQWGQIELVVSAVYADLPTNTHLHLQGFLSLDTWRPHYGHIWESQSSNGTRLYLQPQPDFSGTELAKLLSERIEGHFHDSYGAIELQPVTQIHLFSYGLQFEWKPGGSVQAVYVAIGLALGTLLIATFNFINLSTARASLRAKEIGVRKALGASRAQLISQLLFEALLLTATAALLACVWAELALPHFNRLMNSTLDIDYFGEVGPVFLVMVVTVGVLAGAYPALYLSSFNSARVLSGDLSSGRGAIRTRRVLIGLQSAISIGLIVASVGVIAQLVLLQHQPLGYSKEQRLVIRDMPNAMLRSADNFGQHIDATGLVSHWTFIDKDPTRDFNMNRRIRSNGETASITMKMGYDNFATTLGLELLAGRDFSAQFQGDRYDPQTQTIGVLINREAALALGYPTPQDALHQTWHLGQDNVAGTVIGVVESYKAGPAMDNRAIFFTHSYSAIGTVDAIIELKRDISTQEFAELKEHIERPLPKGMELDMHFMDAIYQAQFDQQRRQFALLLSMTAVALALTVIGLFGLAAFSCERRSKEIAMRKVLGSSYASIVALINKEFVALVALGSLVAWPLAASGLTLWLEHFLHRVELAWWWFPMATAVVLAITIATVSALALNTARQRPALTLRDE
ncbi:ABC transporter permease [Ferrimonas pelagia]|uniref:ABC transporter permease n=1 Tax=Ferrimonas pelagia TaxID=1177826 RepID=A0ABP9ESY7_9GAMM